MERTETAETPGAEAPGALLDGVPRQRGPVPEASAVPVVPAVETLGAPFPKVWRLLPTPTGTPFTFWYAVLLVVTSYVAEAADPSWVDGVLQASSTDVTHLVHSPVLVLVASALWVAGGLGSPFVAVFLLVLTALERRVGGARTAAIFLTGHVVATLSTEIPVGLAVLVGHLPETSLHRYDFGISFGVAASVGALCGVLRPWVRWPVLVGFGGLLLQDLANMADPVSNWGHLIALSVGVGLWRWVRRWNAEGVAAGGVAGAVVS